MPDTAFTRIGKRLVAEGLVSGNFGNLSTRKDGGFSITPRGTFVDEPHDPVFVPDTGPVPPEASGEYRVHRETYRQTHYRAIVHAHPPFAIAASFHHDTIIPDTCEAAMMCPVIPVVEGEAGSEALARAVAGVIRQSPVVVARGHGTFAAGSTLKEAYIRTSSAEHACRILLYRGLFGGLSR